MKWNVPRKYVANATEMKKINCYYSLVIKIKITPLNRGLFFNDI